MINSIILYESVDFGLQFRHQLHCLTEELLRGLQGKQVHVEAQLEGIRVEHEGARELLDLRRDQLGRTLRAMYTRGAANAAQVMLRTTSLRDALTRVKYLNLVARNNELLGIISTFDLLELLA